MISRGYETIGQEYAKVTHVLPFLSLHLTFYTKDLDKLERDVKTSFYSCPRYLQE